MRLGEWEFHWPGKSRADLLRVGAGILTWWGRYHGHEGGFLRARLIPCTLDVLTPVISPKCKKKKKKKDLALAVERHIGEIVWCAEIELLVGCAHGDIRQLEVKTLDELNMLAIALRK